MCTCDVTKSSQEPIVGSLAGSVSPGVRVLARNVSRKCPLFASPSALVCRPLQVPEVELPNAEPL